MPKNRFLYCPFACFQQNERSPPEIDFDIEGNQKLTDKLKVELRKKSAYSHANPVYKHSETGGIVYVGDIYAASDASLLAQLGVTGIVNCTKPTISKRGELGNFFEDSNLGFVYHDFPVSDWYRHRSQAKAQTFLLDFFVLTFKFIERALKRGESVLVHCLAGAHRAGTVGVSCLMYFEGLQMADAILSAKVSRPMIDPIGHLVECLSQLDVELERSRNERLQQSALLSPSRQGAAEAGEGESPGESVSPRKIGRRGRRSRKVPVSVVDDENGLQQSMGSVFDASFISLSPSFAELSRSSFFANPSSDQRTDAYTEFFQSAPSSRSPSSPPSPTSPPGASRVKSSVHSVGSGGSKRADTPDTQTSLGSLGSRTGSGPGSGAGSPFSLLGF